jgi:D-threo-aldose 1-dehydrogenase
LGAPDRPDPDELAEAMLRSGFPAVDTSNRYASGHSEGALGRAIRRVGLPDSTVVITKADADTETGVFDGDRVRRSFEESIGRLGVDRLPLLQLHDPYTITFAEAMSPGGRWRHWCGCATRERSTPSASPVNRCRCCSTTSGPERSTRC